MSQPNREIPAWVGITYLIYCCFCMGLIMGGAGYAVFVLGHSGWWMLAAVFLLSGCFKPARWAQIVTGDPEDDDVPATPSPGAVGGINRDPNPWWRNKLYTGS